MSSVYIPPPSNNPQPAQGASLQQQIRQVQSSSQGQSFLDRIKNKMNGHNGFASQWRAAPKERSRHTIRSNRWDELVWAEARKTQDIDRLVTDLSLGDEHKGGERKPFEMAPELVHDIFLSLYKAAPHLLLKREIIKAAMPVRKIMEEILESPKLEELQEMTATDAVMSTIAVTAMADVIREILTRIPPPPPPGGTCGGGCPTNPGGGGEKGQGNCTCQPAGPEGGCGGEEVDEDGDLTDDEGRTLDMDRAREQAEIEAAERDWENEFQGLLDEADIDRLVNKALDEADNQVDDLDNLRKGIGLEDGEWRTMDPSQRMAMAARLNSPNMKALADIIGKMKRFALGIKATKIVDVPHEAYDVEQGREIRRLLKAQFALLGNPVTKYEFYRRYADGELMQYKMRGREEIGKGPILMGIDKSGSMSGEPFNWAMAVAEALRRFAADEDRDFFAAFFGSNHDRERFEFPKGKAPFEKVLTFLSCQANGGTQFDGILEELLGRATKEYDEFGTTKSDIIFITDGQSHLDEEWIKKFNAEKERIGVRVYSVFVGGAYDMGGRGGPVGLLNQFSDGVINVKELTPEAVEQIFQKV